MSTNTAELFSLLSSGCVVMALLLLGRVARVVRHGRLPATTRGRVSERRPAWQPAGRTDSLAHPPSGPPNGAALGPSLLYLVFLGGLLKNPFELFSLVFPGTFRYLP